MDGRVLDSAWFESGEALAVSIWVSEKYTKSELDIQEIYWEKGYDGRIKGEGAGWAGGAVRLQCGSDTRERSGKEASLMAEHLRDSFGQAAGEALTHSCPLEECRTGSSTLTMLGH